MTLWVSSLGPSLSRVEELPLLVGVQVVWRPAWVLEEVGRSGTRDEICPPSPPKMVIDAANAHCIHVF